MDYVVILLLQIGSAIASLVLMSIGLAVIFGMMRVINLAHGEFLMLGGYAAITAFNLGVNSGWRCWWWRRSRSGSSAPWSSGW